MDASYHDGCCFVMDVVWIIIAILVSINLVISIILRKKKVTINHNPPPPQVHVNLKPLQDVMEGLPNKVLQSITSSSNTHKGAIGELIGFLQLRASYDRIIPLGGVIDFVGIKLPGPDSDGHIDFIDVKTGNRCRLSKEQQALQKLIKEKKINFIRLKVETTQDESSS